MGNDSKKVVRSTVRFSKSDEECAKELNGTSKDMKKLAEEYELSKHNGFRGLLLQQSTMAAMSNTTNLSWGKQHVLRFISLSGFDAAIGAVISGIETSYGVKGLHPPMTILILEVIFLCVYL